MGCWSLDGVLVGEEVNDLEGMLDNAHGHELLALSIRWCTFRLSGLKAECATPPRRSLQTSTLVGRPFIPTCSANLADTTRLCLKLKSSHLTFETLTPAHASPNGYSVALVTLVEECYWVQHSLRSRSLKNSLEQARRSENGIENRPNCPSNK